MQKPPEPGRQEEIPSKVEQLKRLSHGHWTEFPTWIGPHWSGACVERLNADNKEHAYKTEHEGGHGHLRDRAPGNEVATTPKQPTKKGSDNDRETEIEPHGSAHLTRRMSVAGTHA